MESGKILDSAITASSHYGDDLKPQFARLNARGGSCSWAPKAVQDAWILVDFGEFISVTGVDTQGRCDNGRQWVKSYTLSYSADGQNWILYMERGSEKVPFISRSKHRFISDKTLMLVF